MHLARQGGGGFPATGPMAKTKNRKTKTTTLHARGGGGPVPFCREAKKTIKKLSPNHKNPRTPYVILGKVYFSYGKSLCAAPETPRFEHTPGIEPGTPGVWDSKPEA